MKLIVLGLVLLTLGAGLLGTTLAGVAVFEQSMHSGTTGRGGGLQGDNQVTLMARAMAAHLHGPPTCPSCGPDAWYDSGFPPAVLDWARAHCPGCSAWQNGTFQCVALVLGSYALFHPLPYDGNGNVFWSRYGTPAARSLGFEEVSTAPGHLPVSPGDIMAWQGGPFGHVSIVLSWQAPSGRSAGSITYAQANAEGGPIATLPIALDGSIGNHHGYFVQGYIHPSWLPAPTGGSGGASGRVVRIAQLDPAQYGSSQEYHTWAYAACSAAAMTEILNAYGGHYRIHDILTIEAARGDITPSLGLVRPGGIEDTLTQFGMKTQWAQNFSLDQLSSIIATANGGRPVIVDWPPDKFAGGHILVVTGGDATSVFLADSSGYTFHAMSISQFMGWWGGFYAVAP
ncbi:MAG: CHAP domain-containing protein [Chloroflexota bacterium]|nr:CHAP domain-containing protein [Chloroflexota bacterium]